MAAITKSALKAIKFYKHVVQSVEKFIQKVRLGIGEENLEHLGRGLFPAMEPVSDEVININKKAAYILVI